MESNNLTREEKLKVANDNLNVMQEMMLQKGLNQREINNILSTYREYETLRTNNDEEYIKNNHCQDYPTYSSEKVTGVRFETKNEVRLLHCLNNINPNINSDQLGKMVGMIYHMLGVKTGWYTIPDPNKK